MFLRSALHTHDRPQLKKWALILREQYPQLSALLFAISTCTKEELALYQPEAINLALALIDISFKEKDLN